MTAHGDDNRGRRVTGKTMDDGDKGEGKCRREPGTDRISRVCHVN